MVGAATVSGCRTGLPPKVQLPNDTLICAPNAAIASGHLLTAVAEQNYGAHSYRVRQPFDFAARTGTVVFDADATIENGLYGWISVAITEDPTPTPSFSLYAMGNYEGAVMPRNALELQLSRDCPGGGGTGLGSLHEFSNHADRVHTGFTACVGTSRHHLNRFELRVSQSQVELWASDASPDGTTFGPLKQLASVAVALPFTRGFVQLTTHNHATLKYSNDLVDAWVTRWDNVGFDGPVLARAAEFEVPDSLATAGGQVGFGYVTHNGGQGPAASLSIKGVAIPPGATTAQLTMTMLYLQNQFGDADLDAYAIVYRLNGKAWHTQPLTTAERGLLKNGVALSGDATGLAGLQGALGHFFEVPLADLAQGDNVLEVATANVGPQYATSISNVTLLVH
ncbi:MAG: hypothetical protein K1X89_17010 [Myxococcaceae bacterium]|nr:hypothetical protein [Myxococcaceae bacterium]